MSSDTIYHGSSLIVEKPSLDFSSGVNDFGKGFYCTQNADLAREWACSAGKSGYVNKYTLHSAGLDVLNIPDSDIGTLTWVALLLQFRKFRITSDLMKEGVDWLDDRFHVNLSNYDVLVAPRADESYFSFVRAFLSGEIALPQLTAALKLDSTNPEFVLLTEAAVNRLEFESFAPADTAIFYPKRKNRDYKLRKKFVEKVLIKNKDTSKKPWYYISDIVEQGVTARDLLVR